MELNVGDYVRTKDYGFIKIKSFYYSEDMIHILDENCNEYDFSKELVDDFKSSPNIIDLIEVGDYVNEYYVEDITNTGEELVLHIITGSNYFQSPFLYNEDIKSVLTHEQFETMKYVVGDN